MKNLLKKSKFILFLYYFVALLSRQLKINFFKSITSLISVFADYFRLIKTTNPLFLTRWYLWQLYINDKTTNTPLDPVYFYQDTWLASKIFETKPSRHVDVGSSAKTIGILSKFTPIEMVDIRPLPLALNTLHFVKGSITALPYADASLDSVSSICVIEHIGLGRYGDPIDAFGSEKAIAELKRVISSGGHLYISLPVDQTDACLFNNCRTFTRETVLSLFDGFRLIDEQYQYGNNLMDSYSPERGFGTGMFAFQKAE